jgi:hypothetical protein
VCVYLAHKYCFEQGLTESLYRLLFRRTDSAARSAGAEQGDFDISKAVLKFPLVVKGKRISSWTWPSGELTATMYLLRSPLSRLSSEKSMYSYRLLERVSLAILRLSPYVMQPYYKAKMTQMVHLASRVTRLLSCERPTNTHLGPDAI